MFVNPLAAFCKGDSSRRKTQERVNGHWNHDAEDNKAEDKKAPEVTLVFFMPSLTALCKGRLLTTQTPREEWGEWRREPQAKGA